MEIRQNVAEIKRRLQERKSAMQSYASLTRFLISKGITRRLAEEMTLEFTEARLEIEGLPKLLADKILTTQAATEKRIALVGPTGVGKSQVFSALQGKEKGWLDRRGTPTYASDLIDELGEELAGEENLEVWLVLSATMQEIDLYGAIHQFSALLPTSLIFTKLDETLAPGVLVNVSTKCALPIRYISTAKGIEKADPRTITHYILAGGNEKAFQKIRQLAYMESQC